MSKIPATIRGATERLSAIGSLVQASEWERAAIVAAFVTTTTHGGDRTVKATSSLAPHEFAKLGIVGLKSKDTVRRYHDAWMQHSGYERPKPGEFIPDDLPEWGEVVPQITNVSKISTAPGTVAEALKDAAFAAKVMQASTPAAVKSMQKAANEAASSISADEWKSKRDKHDKANDYRKNRGPLIEMTLVEKFDDAISALRAINAILADNAHFDADTYAVVRDKRTVIIDEVTQMSEHMDDSDWDSALAEFNK